MNKTTLIIFALSAQWCGILAAAPPDPRVEVINPPDQSLKVEVVKTPSPRIPFQSTKSCTVIPGNSSRQCQFDGITEFPPGTNTMEIIAFTVRVQATQSGTIFQTDLITSIGLNTAFVPIVITAYTKMSDNQFIDTSSINPNTFSDHVYSELENDGAILQCQGRPSDQFRTCQGTISGFFIWVEPVP